MLIVDAPASTTASYTSRRNESSVRDASSAENSISASLPSVWRAPRRAPARRHAAWCRRSGWIPRGRRRRSGGRWPRTSCLRLSGYRAGHRLRLACLDHDGLEEWHLGAQVGADLLDLVVAIACAE